MSLESSLQRMNELTTMVAGPQAAAATAAQAAPAAGFSDRLAAATGTAPTTDATTAQAAALRARITTAQASIGAVTDDSSDDSSDDNSIDVYGGAGTSSPISPSDLSAAATNSPYGTAPYSSSTYSGGNGYGLPGTAATGGVAGLGATGSTTGVAGGTVGARMVALAQGEVGVTEQPSGSNDSPRIAQYREATAGASGTPGPWCAYFVSYLARSAGAPVGASGQGFGWVGSIEQWGKQTGRYFNSSSATPAQPGDIALFGTHHTGIVESVDAGGRIHTIEGNSSNKVARRDYDRSQISGFVRPG